MKMRRKAWESWRKMKRYPSRIDDERPSSASGSRELTLPTGARKLLIRYPSKKGRATCELEALARREESKDERREREKAIRSPVPLCSSSSFPTTQLHYSHSSSPTLTSKGCSPFRFPLLRRREE